MALALVVAGMTGLVLVPARIALGEPQEVFHYLINPILGRRSLLRFQAGIVNFFEPLSFPDFLFVFPYRTVCKFPHFR